jgi:hypothetical protein
VPAGCQDGFGEEEVVTIPSPIVSLEEAAIDGFRWVQDPFFLLAYTMAALYLKYTMHVCWLG